MHPNPVFRGEDRSRNIEFARSRGFGVLAVSAEGAPLLSHVPFLLDPEGSEALLHLVRSNPIARLASAPTPARIAVSGADSYISPDWYGADDQVPTWNYVAVHLAGTLEPLSKDMLRDVIDRESAFFEDRLAPKPSWSSQKMTPDVLERMMRMIRPFRFRIDTIEGTWKLGQNKPDAVRIRAAEQLEQNGIGQELRMLAALMRHVDSGGKAS